MVVCRSTTKLRYTTATGWVGSGWCKGNVCVTVKKVVDAHIKFLVYLSTHRKVVRILFVDGENNCWKSELAFMVLSETQ